ncbi:MAG: hypothetical protein ACRC3H_24440 [Lachnospiraceae bacterium]
MVLTFDSLEEVLAFTKQITGVAKAAPKEKMSNPEVKEEPKEAPKAESGPEATQEADQEEITYTLPDVRAVLAPIMKAGKKPEVQSLIESFGAAKLSDVKPEDYADLINKAGEL